jgi:hypothetical protein
MAPRTGECAEVYVVSVRILQGRVLFLVRYL